MNVTNKEIKCCQPPKEDSLQKNSSENEGYAGAYDSLKITENNIILRSMINPIEL